MACYRPVTVWVPDGGGKISYREIKDARETKIKCSRCIGCRIEMRDSWAFRCYAESKLHKDNSFITLTYDDDHVPLHNSLNVRDWQLFAKRLRKKAGPFRFFMCGEYGDNTNRPHYHALLFGLGFDDRVKSNSVYSQHDLYSSELLTEVWGQGFATIGEVTVESARYCAAYTTKRVTGDSAREHYSRVDVRTGEIVEVKPEFAIMSRNPGIGSDWIRKYYPEVLTHNAVYCKDRRQAVPFYFQKILEEIEPDVWAQTKMEAQMKAYEFIDNNTRERLEVREQCAHAKKAFNSQRYPNAL